MLGRQGTVLVYAIQKERLNEKFESQLIYEIDLIFPMYTFGRPNNFH